MCAERRAQLALYESGGTTAVLRAIKSYVILAPTTVLAPTPGLAPNHVSLAPNHASLAPNAVLAPNSEAAGGARRLAVTEVGSDEEEEGGPTRIKPEAQASAQVCKSHLCWLTRNHDSGLTSIVH